jgi:hypothetical protein
MPIDVTCSCGKRLRVADEFAGRQGQCPICGVLLAIPEWDAVESDTRATSLEAAKAVIAESDWSESAAQGAPESLGTPRASVSGMRTPEARRPRYKLFSPGVVGLVAFLAGPLGAFILLTMNFYRLGSRRAVWTTIVTGLLTLAALGVLVADNDPMPRYLRILLTNFFLFPLLWAAAWALQRGAYNTHRENGGERASAWAALGFGLLGLLLYFAFIMSECLVLIFLEQRPVEY